MNKVKKTIIYTIPRGLLLAFMILVMMFPVITVSVYGKSLEENKITVSKEEISVLDSRPILGAKTYVAKIVCPDCHGTGYGTSLCEECFGRRCEDCDFTGKAPCSTCGKEGYLFFATLQDAFDNISDNGTITLLSNAGEIVVNKPIKFTIIMGTYTFSGIRNDASIGVSSDTETGKITYECYDLSKTSLRFKVQNLSEESIKDAVVTFYSTDGKSYQATTDEDGNAFISFPFNNTGYFTISKSPYLNYKSESKAYGDVKRANYLVTMVSEKKEAYFSEDYKINEGVGIIEGEDYSDSTPNFLFVDGKKACDTILYYNDKSTIIKYYILKDGKYNLLQRKPTEAGEYKIVFSVPETDNYYYGEAEYTFTIHKLSLKITKNGVAATLDKDYSIDGQRINIKKDGLTISGYGYNRYIYADKNVKDLTIKDLILEGDNNREKAWGYNCIVLENEGDFKLVIKGTNRIGKKLAYSDLLTYTDYMFATGILSHGSLNITGDGTLSIYENESGIRALSDIVFDNKYTGKLIIEDLGEYYDPTAEQPPCAINSRIGNVVINNGTFSLTSFRENGITVDEGKNIIINGGSISAKGKNLAMLVAPKLGKDVIIQKVSENFDGLNPSEYNSNNIEAYKYIVISKIKEVALPEKDIAIFVYTGQEQTYNLKENALFRVIGNKRTDAGIYSVIVSLKDKVNYKWSNNSNDDLSYEFVIEKAKNNINDLKLESWTAGDKPNSPTSTADFGEVQYIYSKSNLPSFDMDKLPQEPGKYIVKAYVVGNDNYESAEQELTFEIYEAKTIDFGMIIGICAGIILISYVLGYFLAYRRGKLEGKKIEAIYKFLPKKS